MKILKGIALYVRAVAELFPLFLKRESKIAELKAEIKRRSEPLERELRLLTGEQEIAEKAITENVAAVGDSLLIAGHVLSTEENTKVARTAVGVKELLDELKASAPTAHRQAALALARLEEVKREHNQKNAVVTTKFVYRPAAPGERASVLVDTGI